jgi:hypothetical protein
MTTYGHIFHGFEDGLPWPAGGALVILTVSNSGTRQREPSTPRVTAVRSNCGGSARCRRQSGVGPADAAADGTDPGSACVGVRRG